MSFNSLKMSKVLRQEHQSERAKPRMHSIDEVESQTEAAESSISSLSSLSTHTSSVSSLASHSKGSKKSKNNSKLSLDVSPAESNNRSSNTSPAASRKEREERVDKSFDKSYSKSPGSLREKPKEAKMDQTAVKAEIKMSKSRSFGQSGIPMSDVNSDAGVKAKRTISKSDYYQPKEQSIKSITTEDINLLQRLQVAIKKYPGAVASVVGSESGLRNGTGSSDAGGSMVRNSQKQAESKQMHQTSTVTPSVSECQGLMFRYILEKAIHEPSCVVLLPGHMPDPSCFYRWGDWRHIYQKTKAATKMVVVLPDEMKMSTHREKATTAPETVAETLVLRSLTNLPGPEETKMLFYKVCEYAAANMAVETMKSTATIFGMLSHDEGVSSDHPKEELATSNKMQSVICCALASEFGLLLANRCSVSVRINPMPSSYPFSKLTITLGVDSETLPDLSQLLFRPIILKPLGYPNSVAWVCRLTEERNPPTVLNNAETNLGATTAASTGTTAAISDIQTIASQMQLAANRGGRVGMAVEMLTRTMAFSIINEIQHTTQKFLSSVTTK